MKVNERVQVRADHPFHPGRVGYFQFMGGTNRDAVVLAEDPEKKNPQVLFAVNLKDLV